MEILIVIVVGLLVVVGVVLAIAEKWRGEVFFKHDFTLEKNHESKTTRQAIKRFHERSGRRSD